tara:strand:+ start:2099 stop:2461 length:363 start_codon:yes stop_codon:yes gene_type:complete
MYLNFQLYLDFATHKKKKYNDSMFSFSTTIFIYAILISFILSFFLRLFFNRKRRQIRDDFLNNMEAQMKELALDLDKKRGDLQESVDMLNQEYADVVQQVQEDLSKLDKQTERNKKPPKK